MISSLILAGVFQAEPYDTPPSRTQALLLLRRLVRLPPKYADEMMDYRLDWSQRLDGDKIESSAIAYAAGVSVPSRLIHNDTTTSFWIAGGRLGNDSRLEVMVVTNGGRAFSQTLVIRAI